jgi:5-methyltetrahydrofolate--homocysteine methyltransferase
MTTESLERLRASIIGMDAAASKALTAEAIEGGVDPLEIVEKAIRPSLDQIGADFEAGRVFLPELVAAGNIASEVGALVEEAMAGDRNIPTKGTVALGTVKGDIHSIGKNIVGVMMKAFGFKVVDLGVDVSPEEFLEAAPGADIVAMSGLLTTATRSMKEVIGAVGERYPQKHIITGGAAMNPELAKALGVLYGPDAASGVRMLNEALAG